jgi:hypothetical protein
MTAEPAELSKAVRVYPDIEALCPTTRGTQPDVE